MEIRLKLISQAYAHEFWVSVGVGSEQMSLSMWQLPAML